MIMTVRKPPRMAKKILKIISNGFTIMEATTLGNIIYEAGLIPITSKASICSVTRILPTSAVMREPRLPTSSKLIMVGQSSMTMDVLDTKPTVHAGIQLLSIWSAVWVVITLPMDMETMQTMSMEPMPIASISLMSFLKKILHLSGFEKTLRKKTKYSPVMVNKRRTIISKKRAKIRFFCIILRVQNL